MSQSLGVLGERQAAEYFVSRGGVILGRNVRYSCGEIDLIVQLDGVVIFVEVKTRTTEAFGAAESVSPAKFSRMRRAAAKWLEGQPYLPIRFDVLVIVMDTDEVTHYEGIDRGSR